MWKIMTMNNFFFRNAVVIAAISFLIISCNNEVSHPTYAEHVAPIIHRSCVQCHRVGMIGHFDLLTFDDVRLKAEAIKQTVSQRIMPPWPADHHYRSFADENILTDQEIRMVTKWIDQGCPRGDSTKEPQPPALAKNSMLGKPDYSIPIGKIPIKGNYLDKFMLVKVPFELPNEAYAKVIEYVPGNTKVVHHINGSLVRFDDGKKKNLYDGDWYQEIIVDSNSKTTYQKLGLLHDDGTYPTLYRSAFNYLPGVITPTYPEGIGHIKLNKKNAFILKDLHYGPFWEETYDSSYINIFLSKTPTTRQTYDIQLGTLGVSPIEPELNIPPDTILKVQSKYTIPEAMSIININPHMHLLGKDFWAFAVPPNGDTIPLIKIPRWDFNWQNFYKPKQAIVLPAQTTIYSLGTYDNTVNNPFNPNKPPQLVIGRNGSMRTTDEMFQLILTFMLYQKGDEHLNL